jgi:hypothetical protein
MASSEEQNFDLFLIKIKQTKEPPRPESLSELY